MKKRPNINNRIIGRMLIIVIVISAAILGGYTFVQYHDILSRAQDSIRAYQQDAHFYLNEKANAMLFAYECYVGQNPKEYVMFFPEEDETVSYELDPYEAALADTYLAHPDRYQFGQIYSFRNPSCFIVFMPMDDAIWEENEYRVFFPETQDSLVCCDVAYLMSSLGESVLLVGAIIAAMILLLFFVSRYTVKLLDKKDVGMKNFFANASHELKTPLMSIRGNVDGIRDGYVEVNEGCEIIGHQVDRMSDLIGGILEISRLDSQAVKPDMMDCDVREILYDAASAILPEARKKGITIDMNAPDPIFRKCDESMIYSAFSNILTNAVRYAQSLIAVSAATDAAGKTTILVENDGDPISEEDRLHVFDRFYKGEKGQSGIGMALAQEYVRLHGSKINALVRHGHTVFELRI